MADAWHIKWLAEGVHHWNQRRRLVSFRPDLSGVNFFELLPRDFRDSPKTSRYFEGIDLTGANLNRSDLSNLNFYRANFSDATLVEARLERTNFDRCKFARADLSDASLRQSTFRFALLSETLLGQADVSATDFGGAVLRNGLLSQKQEAAAAVIPIYRATRSASRDMVTANVQREEPSGTPSRVQDARTKKIGYFVYFGTNRKANYERNTLVGYGDGFSDELSYGLCEVVVPDGRRIGQVGTPLWRKLFNLKETGLTIDKLVSLNDTPYWKYMSDTSAKMRDKQRPTLFIHGYNTDFEEAILRAAQIGHDIGIGRGIGLFSWPSKGKFFGYPADEAAAEASKYALADFIEAFINHSPESSIDIIAHSMGCRCLLSALEILTKKNNELILNIGQIILAAADVDTAIMPRLALPAIARAERITSYISDRDKALQLSGWLHRYPRVGVTPPTFVLNGVDTVVVNNLGLIDLSHGYLGKSRAILSDIHALLMHNSAPSDRHSIVGEIINGQEYWRMKE